MLLWGKRRLLTTRHRLGATLAARLCGEIVFQSATGRSRALGDEAVIEQRASGGVPAAARHAWRAVRAAYGPNYDRLLELRRRYDPENLFHYDHNIVP